MSIKNQIISEIKSGLISEIKSLGQDLVAAKQLDPTMNVITSTVATAQKKPGSVGQAARFFKDEVIHKTTEGVQALGRLGERFNHPERMLSRLWSQPPSVILRD